MPATTECGPTTRTAPIMKPSERSERRRAVQLPGGGFPHPLQDPKYNAERDHGREAPRTVSGLRYLQRCCTFSISFHQIVELRMCALSYRIREKHKWWEKVRDETVVEKWREEALQQEERGDLRESEWKLTPAMVRFSTFEPLSSSLFRYLGRLCTRGAPWIRISA